MGTESGFRDVYFDGLLSQTSQSYFKMEELNTTEFDLQAKSAIHRPELDPIVFTFWGSVLGRIFPVKEALAVCQLISELLSKNAIINVSPSWLLLRVSTAYWQSRMYVLLIRRIRPKVVLVSDTGEYGLCIASKSEGVHFLELQHGVFDENHPDAIPLWVQGTSSELLLPDTLACKGQYWIDKLSRTLQGRHCAVPVGNELIDLARQQRAKRSAHDDFVIVVTSQGLDSKNFANWLVEAVKSAPNPTGWRIFIKLHPVYDKGNDSFRVLNADDRVQIIAGQQQPNVYDLLSIADLHISIASACIFDAAALGVPSLIVPLAGHTPLVDSIGRELIRLASDPSDCWTPLPEIEDDQVTDRFSRPGFLNNMSAILDGLRNR